MEITEYRIEIDCAVNKLIELEQAYRAMVQIRSPRGMKDIRDKAEAVRKYAQSAVMGLHIQNQAAELRLRAERDVGRLLHEMCLPGGDRRSKLHDETENLEDMGIQRIQSHRWQQVASIPDDMFEDFIRECNCREKEITFAGLIRYANRRILRSQEPVKGNDDGGIRRIDAMLRKLVATEVVFPSICIYPPWPNRRRSRVARVDRRFFKRFIEKLRNLPIADLAAASCHVHVWTTSERLRDGIRLLESWGFTYRDVLVCCKPNCEYGSYYHAAHESILLGTKGDRVFDKSDVPSLVDANDQMINGVQLFIRPVIEQVNPGPYLEAFGLRKKPRPEWTIVGE